MSIRQERIQELIQTHLSMLFMMEVTDPALQGLTVTQVRVDREIEYADIYIHALGEDEREPEVMAGLERANGFLRRQLAGRLSLRKVPVLHFHWDERLAAADHMEQILDALKAEREAASPNISTDNPKGDHPAEDV